MVTNRFRFLLVATVLSTFVSFSAMAQFGCTDSQALNYDPSAVVNDGSCTYPATTLSTTLLTPLQTPLLDENSGLFHAGGEWWSHVDDTFESLYSIDTVTGNVTRTTNLSGITNWDWEEAQADSNYIYIGDIGNNSGARTDLAIYRYPLSVLDSGVVALFPDTIRWTFSDQTDFSPALNNTRFDCEAFVIINDTIHLFSKDWVLKNTRRYTLPAVPGNHVALLQDSLPANGLITGASVNSDGVVVLLGYDNQIPAPCFLWMLYDYPESDVFDGNKRRFSLGTALTLGQTEAISFREGNYGYISNERFQQSIFNVAPQLRSFSLDNYLTSSTAGLFENTDNTATFIYPQPSQGEFTITTPFSGIAEYRLMDLGGRVVYTSVGQADRFHCMAESLVPGLYIVEISCQDGRKARSRVIFR